VLLGAHHILHVSRIGVKERGCGAMDCIYLAQGEDNGQWTLVNVLLNHYILLNVRNILTNREIMKFSKRTLLHGVSQWG